ncbi:hypothetical protein NQZ68_026818 [Dissostichus eleginoides]|nr:hypothetical protein NQZ68_026818 [Dissostichus eleginoides]
MRRWACFPELVHLAGAALSLLLLPPSLSLHPLSPPSLHHGAHSVCACVSPPPLIRTLSLSSGSSGRQLYVRLHNKLPQVKTAANPRMFPTPRGEEGSFGCCPRKFSSHRKVSNPRKSILKGEGRAEDPSNPTNKSLIHRKRAQALKD